MMRTLQKTGTEARSAYLPGLLALLLLPCLLALQPLPDAVEARGGDLVQVRVQVRAENGEEIYATPAGARDQVVVGEETPVPGLGAALVGMKTGESRDVAVSAKDVGLKPDPQLQKELPCRQKLPRLLKVPAERFVKVTGGFPQAGAEVQVSPYLTARVAAIDRAAVELAIEKPEQTVFEEPFGTVTIRDSGEEMETVLQPKIGAPFSLGGQSGRITASDGETFTVDFNPPHLGRNLNLHVELVERVPAEQFEGLAIDWQENLEEGLSLAREQHKPAIMILYADWCQWCERFFRETASDPRVLVEKDKFVWLKVNSDVESRFKEQFEQSSFPMLVFFDADGRVIRKTEGFLDGAKLAASLQGLAGQM